MSEVMGQLFELMFGAGGRINRAKYWKSMLIYCIAGLFSGVLLLTAAGLAVPLFIIAVVVVLIPWLIWGFDMARIPSSDEQRRRPDVTTTRAKNEKKPGSQTATGRIEKI
jgi:hypothetical protein